MIRLEIKNYNMILTGKQHYHQIKLINMNILQVKKQQLTIQEKTNKNS